MPFRNYTKSVEEWEDALVDIDLSPEDDSAEVYADLADQMDRNIASEMTAEQKATILLTLEFDEETAARFGLGDPDEPSRLLAP